MQKYPCILALLLFASAIAVSAGTGHRTSLLSDFERESELSKFGLRAVDKQSFAMTSHQPLVGEHSAHLTFRKWQKGTDEWPALILPLANGLPGDWSGYEVLAMDVRNDSKTKADLAFYVDDRDGSNAGSHFYIGPGESTTLRFPLYNVKYLNVFRVREMNIYATRPPEDMPLTIDNLRLEEDLDARLSFIEQRLLEMKKRSRLAEVSAMLGRLDTTCRDLHRRLSDARSIEERESVRGEIVALERQSRFAVPRTISEAEMRAQFGKISSAPYACGFATSMEKVFPKDIPFHAQVGRNGRIELAGNEVEALQLLILAGNDGLKNVQVSVSALKRTDGVAVSKVPVVTTAPMGFVETKKPPYRADYVGWYPDPILDFLKSVDMKAGELQPVWIEVRAPAGTLAGEYQGEIAVKPENAPEVKLGLHVKVWDFDVPAETHLRTALSLREEPIEQVYGSVSREMWHKYCDFTLDHRLSPDNIYWLNTPRLDDIIRWSGKGLTAFNVIYAMKPADLKPNAMFPEDRKKEIMAQLDAFIPKLKERGLYEKAYLYGFDEVRPDSFNAMKDIFSTIKAKYPDLLTMTTGYDGSYGEATGLSMIDAWVPLTRAYNPERAEKARARGKQVWWYICIEPKNPYANWLIEYDAIDARSLMGMQTAKYQPDGFLYYAINRWPLSRKPITEGPYTDWPTRSAADWNGDGSIMCAGPDGPLSTIRMENIRDGIEDNEYFWLLRQEIRRLESIPGPEAYHALKHAEKALAIGGDVVKSLTSFSKSPNTLYAKRRQVAQAIMEARKVR